VKVKPLPIRRKLHFRFRGQQKTGFVSIGSIFQKRNGVWACRCRIAFLYHRGGAICGEDPLHALTLSLRLVRDLIRGSEKNGWEIWWLSKGDHGGF